MSTVIGALPPGRREGELLMSMVGTDLGQSASGMSVSELNAYITRSTSLRTDSTVPFDQGAYTVEKRCLTPSEDARVCMTLLQK